MIEAGQVIFAKNISTNVKPNKAIHIKLKGHAIAVVLGIVKPKANPPSREQIVELMGNIGWFNSEDIEKCFGKNGWTKFVKFYQNKINGIKMIHSS